MLGLIIIGLILFSIRHMFWGGWDFGFPLFGGWYRRPPMGLRPPMGGPMGGPGGQMGGPGMGGPHGK